MKTIWAPWRIDYVTKEKEKIPDAGYGGPDSPRMTGKTSFFTGVRVALLF